MSIRSIYKHKNNTFLWATLFEIIFDQIYWVTIKRRKIKFCYALPPSHWKSVIRNICHTNHFSIRQNKYQILFSFFILGVWVIFYTFLCIIHFPVRHADFCNYSGCLRSMGLFSFSTLSIYDQQSLIYYR